MIYAFTNDVKNVKKLHEWMTDTWERTDVNVTFRSCCTYTVHRGLSVLFTTDYKLPMWSTAQYVVHSTL